MNKIGILLLIVALCGCRSASRSHKLPPLPWEAAHSTKLLSAPMAAAVIPAPGFQIDGLTLTATTVTLHWRNGPPGPICVEGATNPSGPWAFIDESETDFLTFPNQGDITFFRLVSIQPAVPGQTRWMDTPATSINDYIRALARDSSDNTLAVGDLNNGLFIRKYDVVGAILWTKHISGTSYGFGAAFDDSGNAYVSGKFFSLIDVGCGSLTGNSGAQGDIFVAKFSPSGQCLWSKAFSSGGGCGANCISVSGSSVYIGGSLGGSINFGPAVVTTGAWLAKLDAANGNCAWAKGFGNNPQNAVNSVAADGSSVWITGTFIGTANFGGGNLVSTNGGFDGFIAQYATSGTHLTSSRFGDAWVDAGYSITLTGDGGAIFGGEFRGRVAFGLDTFTTTGINPIDGILARVNSAGNYIWSKQIAGLAGNFDAVRAVRMDGDTVIIGGDVLGGFDFGCGIGSGQGGKDAFVAKLSEDGLSCAWSRTFGGISTDTTLAVCPGVCAGGSWFGTVDFGLGPVTSGGGGDGFVLGLEP